MAQLLHSGGSSLDAIDRLLKAECELRKMKRAKNKREMKWKKRKRNEERSAKKDAGSDFAKKP